MVVGVELLVLGLVVGRPVLDVLAAAEVVEGPAVELAVLEDGGAERCCGEGDICANGRVPIVNLGLRKERILWDRAVSRLAQVTPENEVLHGIEPDQASAT